MTSADLPVSKHKRRWLQLSLRTFLVLVTIFSVWLGLHVRSARRQQAAVAAIEEMGGHVVYDFEETKLGYGSRKRVSSVPQWLLNRTEKDYFHNVVGVEIVGVSHNRYPRTLRRMAGELLTNLGHLPRLKWLHIDESLATGEVTTAARQLPRIEQVTIYTDAGGFGGITWDLDLSR